MGSKYDTYWAHHLAEIRAALDRAADGILATVPVPGLRDLGKRESWSGLAEVRADKLLYSRRAHATSLGKTVAASGICAQWPQRTFRFALSTAGDVLTITASRGQRTNAVTGRGVRPTPAGQAVSSVSGSASKAAVPAGADHGEFYRILSELAEHLGGAPRLRDCDARSCPRQGVYFFFEDGEVRRDGSSRVVRVGTHALTDTSKATLWRRLRQHRGTVGGGNPGGRGHRASVFRRHVGAALIRRDSQPEELFHSWLDRHGPHEGWASQEAEIEREVSRYIGAMPVLWLSVSDRADRGYVEQNSIALTSRLASGRDPSSLGWLGRHAARTEIRESGLWNVDFITQSCDPGFLIKLEQLVRRQ